MSPNEITTLILSVASLVVSIYSFVYARKAYQFELAKYQSEQQAKDVFLSFPETRKYEHGGYTILENNLEILNKSSSLKLAVYFNVTLRFGLYLKFPMPQPKSMMTITAGIFDEWVYLSGLTELFRALDKQETVRMVILDAETRQRVTFSQDEMKKIEPAPQSYSWKVYTIIPNTVIDYLTSQNAELNLVEMEMMLHPKEWKTQSSRRFVTSFGTPSPEVLSHLFPIEQVSNPNVQR